MHPLNSQQSDNASQRAIFRQILVSPQIRILEKTGFHPKNTEMGAISEIVLFTLMVALLAGSIVYFLGTQSEIPKGVEVLISLALVVIGYDVVKEFMGSTVQAVSAQRFEDGKQEGLECLNQRLEEIHEHYKGKSEESIRLNLHRYYLSQFANKRNSYDNAGTLKIGELNLTEIHPSIREERDKDEASLQGKLERKFEETKQNRLIRYIVQGLSDEEFLLPIALVAAKQTLGKRDNAEMNNDDSPEYKFFRDIYAYLKAWLICSIDNDNGVLMPISTIGLSYPSKNNPDKEAYKTALNHIINEIDRDWADEYFKGSDKAKQTVKEFLVKLIKLIEVYENQEEPT